MNFIEVIARRAIPLGLKEEHQGKSARRVPGAGTRGKHWRILGKAQCLALGVSASVPQRTAWCQARHTLWHARASAGPASRTIATRMSWGMWPQPTCSSSRGVGPRGVARWGAGGHECTTVNVGKGWHAWEVHMLGGARPVCIDLGQESSASKNPTLWPSPGGATEAGLLPFLTA